MMIDKKENSRFKFTARKPGETLDEYLIRHKAHPNQPDRRSATPEEVAECDVTQERLNRGYVIGKK